MTQTTGQPEHWSSYFGFLMACVGFSVGLGNIWRFPYLVGENGGGAFILIYLLCAYGIGVPILMAELLIGRRGQLSPTGSMRRLAHAQGASPHWHWLGRMNLLAAFLIQVTYCVVVGWVLHYLYLAVTTGFSGADPDAAARTFTSLMASPWTLLGWTIATLALTGFITYRGVTKGIERASTIMMPVLFSLLVVMAVYNAFTDGFGQAIRYLFTVDFSKITGAVVLAAIGQAFFSIGIAMAAMMTFGAYLPRNISISQSVLIIISADTLAALVAGLAVFPVVFSFGFDPTSGPGLIFQTYPVALAQMPGHHAIAVGFFVLVLVAGLSSVLGCVEALTAWVQEHFGFSRHKSTVAVLLAVGASSVLSVLSYNALAEWKIAGLDLTEATDYFSNRILLPVGGLLIAAFTGWVMTRTSVLDELQPLNATGFAVWRFAVRFVVPLAIAAILVMGIVG